MSNNLNLSDSINFAIASGKTPTFRYNDTTYEFSPQGLIDFLVAEGGFAEQDDNPVFDTIEVSSPSIIIIPDVDPEIVGALWSDNGTIKVSTGPVE